MSEHIKCWSCGRLTMPDETGKCQWRDCHVRHCDAPMTPDKRIEEIKRKHHSHYGSPIWEDFDFLISQLKQAWEKDKKLSVELGCLQAKCGMIVDGKGNKVGKTVFEELDSLRTLVRDLGDRAEFVLGCWHYLTEEEDVKGDMKPLFDYLSNALDKIPKELR